MFFFKQGGHFHNDNFSNCFNNKIVECFPCNRHFAYIISLSPPHLWGNLDSEIKSCWHGLKGRCGVGFEHRQPDSGGCTVITSLHCLWKHLWLWSKSSPFLPFSVPYWVGHAIEHLRTHFKGWLEGLTSGAQMAPFSPVSFGRVTFWLSAERPQPGSPRDRSGRKQVEWLERQPDDSRSSRACFRIHFLVNLNPGLSGTVTIGPKSSKGELALLRLLSPVSYRTHLRPLTCRSIKICGGHSLELHCANSSVVPLPHPLCSANVTTRLNPGSSSSAPSSCRRDRVIQEVQQCIQVTRTRTKPRGTRSPRFLPPDSSWGYYSWLTHLKKKKKAPAMLEIIICNIEMPFIQHSTNIYWVASMCN